MAPTRENGLACSACGTDPAKDDRVNARLVRSKRGVAVSWHQGSGGCRHRSEAIVAAALSMRRPDIATRSPSQHQEDIGCAER
jgi:hypothetical protein